MRQNRAQLEFYELSIFPIQEAKIEYENISFSVCRISSATLDICAGCQKNTSLADGIREIQKEKRTSVSFLLEITSPKSKIYLFKAKLVLKFPGTIMRSNTFYYISLLLVHLMRLIT